MLNTIRLLNTTGVNPSLFRLDTWILSIKRESWNFKNVCLMKNLARIDPRILVHILTVLSIIRNPVLCCRSQDTGCANSRHICLSHFLPWWRHYYQTRYTVHAVYAIVSPQPTCLLVYDTPCLLSCPVLLYLFALLIVLMTFL